MDSCKIGIRWRDNAKNIHSYSAEQGNGKSLLYFTKNRIEMNMSKHTGIKNKMINNTLQENGSLILDGTQHVTKDKAEDLSEYG